MAKNPNNKPPAIQTVTGQAIQLLHNNNGWPYVKGAAKATTPNPLREAVKNAAPKRFPDHDDHEYIEEIKGPAWLTVALGTDRHQLLGVGSPETLDATDKWFVLNALRVLMETNASLRQRLTKIKSEREAKEHHDKQINFMLADMSRFLRGSIGTGLVMQKALEHLKATWPEAWISDKGFFRIAFAGPQSLKQIRANLFEDGWELTESPAKEAGYVVGMLHRIS